MSVEMTGQVEEIFESRTTPTGFELTGHGALTRLAVEFGEGWSQPVPLPDAVGAILEHELGITAQVVFRSGQRIRLEVTMESPLDEVVSVPGPVLRFEGVRPPIAWLAGASGEVVFPSSSGPGILTLRRGLATPGPDTDSAYLFEFQPWLQPRQLMSAAWTYESYPGDLLDLPAEPSWLPWARYVPRGDAIEISAPDGMVSAGPGVHVLESDGEFELVPPAGPSHVDVWSSAGKTRLEIGSFEGVEALRERFLATTMSTSPQTRYLAARQLVEGWTDEAELDRLDRALGADLEEPNVWTACTAALATTLGLPLEADARRAATRVLSSPTADEVILLAMHGLAPVELTSGEWPVGDFRELGMDAIAAIGYGRITTSERPPRGRDVAVAKLFATALGESELSLRVSSYVQSAENRLLTHLTTQPNATDLAWLSL